MAFEEYRKNAFPYRFVGTLHVGVIAGGTPTDPKVAEAWIKSKMGVDSDRLVQEMVAETMLSRGVSADEAVPLVNAQKNLNGFKRERCPTCAPTGEHCPKGTHPLYYEGRQLKAAIKEAVNVAYSVGKLLNSKGKNSWGLTSKGIHSFAAEHIDVPDVRLPLGVTEASGIAQRFVHTFRGTGIQYEEYVEDAKIGFRVHTDYDFSDANWAAIWLVGERQGIGAARSQGYGRYEVIRWEREK